MTKKKTIGRSYEVPITATGARGNGNKQDMLYIKIFERVNRDILADGMFRTVLALQDIKTQKK